MTLSSSLPKELPPKSIPIIPSGINTESQKLHLGQQALQQSSRKPLPTPPVKKNNPSNAYPTSWKERGDYHLQRKEFELADKAYGEAYNQAIKQNQNIDVACKDVGIYHLMYEFAAETPWHLRKSHDNERWTLAAVNLAIALHQYEKKSPPDKNGIQQILFYFADLERKFFEKEWGIASAKINVESYFRQRLELRQLRQSAGEKILTTPARGVLKDFSENIDKFIKNILKEAFSIVGEPPSEYTFLWLGSLGRKEMSPYSDLEFGLIAEKSPYFKKLLKWLQLRVIFLGETSNKDCVDRDKNPLITKGFAFDDGGNTPIGKEELIGTVEELASRQLERFYEEDFILVNALKDASPITIETSQYQAYRNQVQAVLREPSRKDKNLTTGQWRAGQLMHDHLLIYKVDVSSEKEENPLFNIKDVALSPPLFFNLLHGLLFRYRRPKYMG